MDVFASKDVDDYTIEMGVATWQHKYPDQKCISVRARYTLPGGRFNRGSPEVPIECLPEMVKFVVEQLAEEVSA